MESEIEYKGVRMNVSFDYNPQEYNFGEELIIYKIMINDHDCTKLLEDKISDIENQMIKNRKKPL